ncbi:MAG: hypothetical protein HOE97_08960 [Rhodospirillaceae bacterium]|nr:hypothetical protein [Rhodospirillaceae bacterium]
MSILQSDQNNSSPEPRYDLADHFLACARLGRYLTVASRTRFFISDDFQDRSVIHEAAAVAAIYSKDNLVAEAALMPLSGNISHLKGQERDKYERLFHLIEQQTLSEDVRYSAKSLIESRFRESEIREIEAQLGGKISPARERYRLFLGLVKQLMDQKITAKPFIEEFKEFTQDVAGKLDFGIYSFCLDSLFRSLQIPATVKKLLGIEIIAFPALIRRELLSNVLSYPGQTRDLVEFVGSMMDRQLDPEAVIEIDLLKDLKLRRFSMEAISELAIKSGLSSLH